MRGHIAKIPRTAAVFLIFSLLTGCGPGQKASVSSTFFAMDTVMELTVYGDESLLKEAEQLVYDLEAQLSVTRSDSEIARMNRTGSQILSPETGDLLTRSLALCARTGGALDLSIYPVLRAWGFTTGEYQVPQAQELERLLSHVDYRQIQYDPDSREVKLPQGMEIDLGSVAKGYTGDRLISLLREAGVSSALVNLGGNVQALGEKPDGQPWRVGVQDPEGQGYVGILELRDQAAITSGGYQRYFEAEGNTYWHILDPATGTPARSGLRSVTVVGDCGLTCDGLSTALFVMGRERGAALWRASNDFEAIFVDDEGNVTITEGLENSFSLMGDYEQADLTILYR